MADETLKRAYVRSIEISLPRASISPREVDSPSVQQSLAPATLAVLAANLCAAVSYARRSSDALNL